RTAAHRFEHLPRHPVQLECSLERDRVDWREQRVRSLRPGDVHAAEQQLPVLRWFRDRSLRVHEVPAALLIATRSRNWKRPRKGPLSFFPTAGGSRRRIARAASFGKAIGFESTLPGMSL